MIPNVATSTTENGSLASGLSQDAASVEGSARPSANAITQPQLKLCCQHSNPLGSSGANIMAIDGPDKEQSVISRNGSRPDALVSGLGNHRRGQTNHTGPRQCRIADIIN